MEIVHTSKYDTLYRNQNGKMFWVGKNWTSDHRPFRVMYQVSGDSVRTIKGVKTIVTVDKNRRKSFKTLDEAIAFLESF